MSLLARSLLALAALLAAADAIMPPPFPECDIVNEGEKSADSYKITLPLHFRDPASVSPGDLDIGAMVKFPDKCSRPGSKLGGQHIEVCSFYGTPKIKLPDYGDADDFGFPKISSFVTVKCPGCTDHPSLTLTQYCKAVVPPN